MGLCRRVLEFLPHHFLLIAWVALNGCVFYRTYFQYKEESRFYYLRRMLGCGLCFSRASAAVLNISCCFILIPVCHSISSFVRSLKPKISKRFFTYFADRSKGIHIGVAFTILLASVMHTFAHLANAYNFSRNFDEAYSSINIVTYPDENPLVTLLKTAPGSTGSIMVFVLILLFLTSVKRVRLRHHDLFSHTHKLAFLFLLLLIIHPMRGILKEQVNLDSHIPGCNMPNSTLNSTDNLCISPPLFRFHASRSWLWVTIPVSFYFGDVVFRLLRRSKSVHIIAIKHHSDSVVELCLKQRGLAVRPGQFILMQCPLISRLEWHPFTVTSCPTTYSPVFSILIRENGDWTRHLRSRLRSSFLDSDLGDDETMSNFRLYVDGPFGSTFEDILSQRIAICVAGGIGVTPFAAFLNHLMTQTPVQLQRVHLLWINREMNSFSWLAQLLHDVHFKLWTENKPDVLEFQLYVTMPSSTAVAPENAVLHSDLLLSRLRIGRPKWTELFNLWRLWYRREKVGVFCCGPRRLNREVKRLCTLNFKYHEESFA